MNVHDAVHYSFLSPEDFIHMRETLWPWVSVTDVRGTMLLESTSRGGVAWGNPVCKLVTTLLSRTVRHCIYPG